MPAHKGSRHHLAVLTDADVLDARKEYRKGGISAAELAGRYNVSAGAMRRAIKGTTWSHLPDAVTVTTDAA
jgi:hypothetical protein